MADAQDKSRKPSGPMAIQALTSASATGASTGFQLGQAFHQFGLQVVVSDTSAVTGATLSLEGSLNGTHWSGLSGSTWTLGSQASGDLVFVSGVPVNHIRTTVHSLTTSTASTGTARLDAWISAGE